MRNLYQVISKPFLRVILFIPNCHQYDTTISHDYQFVWFRVPKVCTRTLYYTLDEFNIQADAEHTIWCHYHSQRYKDYFKFAFIRNPWDRLVSCWTNKVIRYNYFKFSNEMRGKYQNFNNFVGYVEKLNVHSCDQHIRMQSSLIDLNSIDYIGRFEKFEYDLRQIFQILGLRVNNIEKINESINRRSYREYYDDQLRDRVENVFKKDIQIFNYKF